MSEPKRLRDCKYFKDCPDNWACLYEVALYGSALWSIQLCYDLEELIQQGLVEVKRGGIAERVAWGKLMYDKWELSVSPKNAQKENK